MNNSQTPAKDNSVIIQEVMANAHRYNQWIYSQFENTVGRRILDVGCSIGNITQKYIDRDKIVAFEVVEESVETVRKRFADQTHFCVHHIGIESPKALEFAEGDSGWNSFSQNYFGCLIDLCASKVFWACGNRIFAYRFGVGYFSTPILFSGTSFGRVDDLPPVDRGVFGSWRAERPAYWPNLK